MLQEIHRLTRYARKYENEFAREILKHSELSIEDNQDRKKKELSAMQVRDKELDRIFNRIYEDNLNGKIDDDRFSRMSSQYTAEQKDLSIRIKTLSSEVDKYSESAMTVDMFVSTVRK